VGYDACVVCERIMGIWCGNICTKHAQFSKYIGRGISGTYGSW